jgi:predicted GH43/DUF377 family glycosyl hydrolase
MARRNAFALASIVLPALLSSCGGSAELGADAGPLLDGGLDAAACVPIDPAPPLGASGYPMDGWAWEKLGVVLEDPTATAALDGFIAPSAVVVGTTLHLFVTRKVGTTHTIHHAATADPRTVPSPTACTGLGSDEVIAYPSALHDGSVFRLWYGSGSIKTATSSDGDAWADAGAAGLSASFTTGAFDSLSVLYPSVLGGPGAYTMYYTGFDGSGFAIGRASSADGLAWARDPANPVLGPGPASSWDNAGVAQPHAQKMGQQTILWYGAYDTSKTSPGPYRVALAAAEGEGAASRRGISLDLGQGADGDAYTTRDPAVIRWHDEWLMFYAGMDADYRYRIMLARSAACPP